MSYHIKSGPIISPHDTSYHTMSDHFIPYHVISYHIKSSHHMQYQNISSRLMSYHIKAHQIILDHIISCHVISYPYLFGYIYLTLEDLPISSMKKNALFGSPEVELHWDCHVTTVRWLWWLVCHGKKKTRYLYGH